MGNTLHRSSVRGISNLGILFFGTIVFCVGWAVYNVIPFYYSFYELEGQMDALAVKASMHNDGYIQKELMKFIKKLEIPIQNEGDLKINRFEGKIVIDLKYEEALSIDLGEDHYYELWVFPFNPHVEREF